MNNNGTADNTYHELNSSVKDIIPSVVLVSPLLKTDEVNNNLSAIANHALMGSGGKGNSEIERGTYDITSPSRREMYKGGCLTGSKILEEVENGHIRIDPFDPTKVNPNSFNLTLNNTLLVYSDSTIDWKKKNPTKKIIIPENGLVLKPGVLYLGRTNEKTWTDRYIPQLDGRSSGGRLGIFVHVTAGYGDIGWEGTWTLEIIATHPVRIYPNIEFCQISYHTPYGLTDIQYQGRYQGQIEATASRSSLDKKVYV